MGRRSRGAPLSVDREGRAVEKRTTRSSRHHAKSTHHATLPPPWDRHSPNWLRRVVSPTTMRDARHPRTKSPGAPAYQRGPPCRAMIDGMLAELTNAIDGALDARAEKADVPPWLGWLAVALLRQRERQAWHRYIVETRLREGGGVGESGVVPGLPRWTYKFHGIGCCLTGPDGECLDVDRLDTEARIIDPYFFAWRVTPSADPRTRRAALAEVGVIQRAWRAAPPEARRRLLGTL